MDQMAFDDNNNELFDALDDNEASDDEL